MQLAKFLNKFSSLCGMESNAFFIKNTEQSSLPASSSLSQSYVVISRAVAVQYFSQIGNTIEC